MYFLDHNTSTCAKVVVVTFVILTFGIGWFIYKRKKNSKGKENCNTVLLRIHNII